MEAVVESRQAVLVGGRSRDAAKMRQRVGPLGIDIKWHWEETQKKRKTLPLSCEVVLFHQDFASHSGFYSLRQLAEKAGVPLVNVGNDWTRTKSNLERVIPVVPKESEMKNAPRFTKTGEEIADLEEARQVMRDRQAELQRSQEEARQVEALLADAIKARPEGDDATYAAQVSECAGVPVAPEWCKSVRRDLRALWMRRENRNLVGQMKREWLHRVFEADLAAGLPLTSQRLLRLASDDIFGSVVGTDTITELRKEFLARGALSERDFRAGRVSEVVQYLEEGLSTSVPEPIKVLPTPITEPETALMNHDLSMPLLMKILNVIGNTGGAVVTIKHADVGAVTNAVLGVLLEEGSVEVAKGPTPASRAFKVSGITLNIEQA